MAEALGVYQLQPPAYVLVPEEWLEELRAAGLVSWNGRVDWEGLAEMAGLQRGATDS